MLSSHSGSDASNSAQLGPLRFFVFFTSLSCFFFSISESTISVPRMSPFSTLAHQFLGDALRSCLSPPPSPRGAAFSALPCSPQDPREHHRERSRRPSARPHPSYPLPRPHFPRPLSRALVLFLRGDFHARFAIAHLPTSPVPHPRLRAFRGKEKGQLSPSCPCGPFSSLRPPLPHPQQRPRVPIFFARFAKRVGIRRLKMGSYPAPTDATKPGKLLPLSRP